MKTEKVCILQLTRIGDIIQTIQAARHFKAENPDSHLTLVCREQFGKGLKDIIETVFDQYFFLNTKTLFKKPTFASGKINLHNFIHELNKQDFTHLLNFSYSKSSGYLSTLIKADHKVGINRNLKSEVVIDDKWSQFVFSNVMSGTQSPFQLVDIYRYILGCESNHRLEAHPNEKENLIILHPFASHKKKRWGLHKWNELIYKLAKDNPKYRFQIVGGPEDTEDAIHIKTSPALEKIQDRITITAGHHSIIETYESLTNAKLFIGHDSMVSHLASETLTPTLVLSLGTVRPHETTPYQEGVINISPKKSCYPCTVQKSCELLPCHTSLNHQAIAKIANGVIQGSEITANFLQEKLNPFQIDSMIIYKSEMTPSGMELHEISNNFKDTDAVFREYYKILWQYFLRGSEIQADLPQITFETAKELDKYIEGTNYLYELYNFGIQYTNKLIDEAESTHPNIEAIQQNIDKIVEINKLCNVTKNAYPHLSGLIDFFYTARANSQGSNLLEVSSNNLLSFYDASNLTAALNEFVAQSIRPFLSHTKSEQEL